MEVDNSFQWIWGIQKKTHSNQLIQKNTECCTITSSETRVELLLTSGKQFLLSFNGSARFQLNTSDQTRNHLHKETSLTPRVIEVAKITPYLLSIYFDVVISFGTEKAL